MSELDRLRDDLASDSETLRAELKQFEDSQQFQRVLDRYNLAWDSWSGTWGNIAMIRYNNLNGESGEDDLATALSDLLAAIRDRGFTDNLPIAVERFDPSYCDGTVDKEEAYAVKFVLGMLNVIAGGTDATEVARAVLSVNPLRPLFRAESARHLLRIADQWPVHCESCECIQPPPSFGLSRCPECKASGPANNNVPAESQVIPPKAQPVEQMAPEVSTKVVKPPSPRRKAKPTEPQKDWEQILREAHTRFRVDGVTRVLMRDLKTAVPRFRAL